MSATFLASLRTKKEGQRQNAVTVTFGRKLSSLPIIDKRNDEDRSELINKFNKANPIKTYTSVFERYIPKPLAKSVSDKSSDPNEDHPDKFSEYKPSQRLTVEKLKERIILLPSIRLLEEPGLIVQLNQTRLSEKPTGIIKDIPSSQLIIKGVPVSDRFNPPLELPKLDVPGYYMNNRKIFIQFIASAFSKYKTALKDDAANATCEYDDNAPFQVMTHQQIVQDYLNLHSPYRGLLLFHGLGSGKTCSSIAIAEGLKTSRGILVMTPASLRRNYIEELKKCGDDLYRKNQFWEFINTNENQELIEPLSALLNLSVEFINTNGGAWLTNVKKPSNFEDLSSGSKANLDKQLYEMIRAKYQFINYNGMRNTHLQELTLNYTINPFDNKVIIIDEAHNFVSRIVNKLSKNTTLSNRLYKYLQEANNCKIVLLSGTPIINYPNEIAILFNILRGNINTWSLRLGIKHGKKFDLKYLQDILRPKLGGNIIDYMEYKSSSTTLMITRNPFGFTNVENKQGYQGVILDQQEISDEQFEELIVKSLEHPSNNIKVLNTIKRSYKALPDTLDDFKSQFMDSHNNLVDMNSFKRRIIGLTSYFRSAQEGLMPAFSKAKNFKVIKIDMSQYQFGVYEEARATERKLELQNSRKRSKKQDNLFDDTVSTYRIFSRAFCNFVFPKEIKRPLPSHDGSLESAIVNGDEDVIDAVPLAEKMENKDSKYDLDELAEESAKLALETPDAETIEKKTNVDDNPITGGTKEESTMDIVDRVSQNIIDSVSNTANDVTDTISNTATNVTDTVSKTVSNTANTVTNTVKKTVSDAVNDTVNLTTSKDSKKTKKRPSKAIKKLSVKSTTVKTDKQPDEKTPDDKASKGKNQEEEDHGAEDQEGVEEKGEDQEGLEEDDKGDDEDKQPEDSLPTKTAIPLNYEDRIKDALARLDKEKDKYLTRENLQIYSPKFLNILENIIDVDHKGLHLVYSQFRTLEGIGILKLVLEANGFAQFKIKENGPGNWLLNMNEDEMARPKFVLYTGTETQEEKEIVRNVFNGEWKYVPTGLAEQLSQISGNNLYGEIIKVFMITASGAEGISLKNTRYVHITEPYWHPVRMQQVIGRARRICSHQDLPEEERTVDVFLYLMTLSNEQKTGDESIELRLKDKSKVDNKTPFTSDEALYEIATLKEDVTTQILQTVKETAFDCVLHTTKGNEEGLKCFTFGNPLPNQFAYKPSLSEEDTDTVADINKKEITAKNLKIVKIGGVDRVINMLTSDVYDLEQYENNVMIKVGKLTETEGETGKEYTYVPLFH